MAIWYVGPSATKGAGTNVGTIANPFHMEDVYDGTAALPNSAGTVAAGDVIGWLDTGTAFTFSGTPAQLTPPVTGSNTDWLTHVAVNSSGVFDDPLRQITINATGTASSFYPISLITSYNYQYWHGIRVVNAQGSGSTYGGWYLVSWPHVLFNCAADSGLGNGFYTSGSRAAIYVMCQANDNVYAGLLPATGNLYLTTVIGGKYTGNTPNIQLGAGNVLCFGPTLDSTGAASDSFQASTYHAWLIRALIADIQDTTAGVDGVTTGAGGRLHAILNLFTNINESGTNAAHAFADNAYLGLRGGNVYHDVDVPFGSGISVLLSDDASTQDTTDPQFVDAATLDFRPTNTSMNNQHSMGTESAKYVAGVHPLVPTGGGGGGGALWGLIR